MTDLEMTRLCARAFFAGRLTCAPGLQITQFEDGKTFVEPDDEVDVILYDPLHDDAQAMALVKRFRLTVEDEGLPGGDSWWVYGLDAVGARSADLNRAIVECVSKLAQSGGQSEGNSLTKVG